MTDASESFKNEWDHRAWVEQYKILVDSLNKLNETRENSNNFWVGVNGLGISATAYLREAHNIAQEHKSFLLSTLVMVGIVFCMSWLSYLYTIKKSIEVRSSLLMEMEKKLPNALFSKIFTYSPEHRGRSVLTAKEMLVPYLFVTGYIFLAILLFFFPEEVAPMIHKSSSPK